MFGEISVREFIESPSCLISVAKLESDYPIDENRKIRFSIGCVEIFGNADKHRGKKKRKKIPTEPPREAQSDFRIGKMLGFTNLRTP